MMELTAWPPSAGSPSTIATRRPNRAACSAAAVPAMPAPTTQMSTATSRAVERVGRRTMRVAVVGSAAAAMLGAPARIGGRYFTSAGATSWAHSEAAFRHNAGGSHFVSTTTYASSTATGNVSATYGPSTSLAPGSTVT